MKPDREPKTQASIIQITRRGMMYEWTTAILVVVLVIGGLAWWRRESDLRKTIKAQKQTLAQCERQQYSLRFQASAVENWVRGTMSPTALIDLVSEDVFIKMVAMAKWPKVSINTLVEFIRMPDNLFHIPKFTTSAENFPHEQDTIHLEKYLAPNGRVWDIGYSEKFDKVIARERSGVYPHYMGSGDGDA